jgi:hypothetical protein
MSSSLKLSLEHGGFNPNHPQCHSRECGNPVITGLSRRYSALVPLKPSRLLGPRLRGDGIKRHEGSIKPQQALKTEFNALLLVSKTQTANQEVRGLALTQKVKLAGVFNARVSRPRIQHGMLEPAKEAATATAAAAAAAAATAAAPIDPHNSIAAVAAAAAATDLNGFAGTRCRNPAHSRSTQREGIAGKTGSCNKAKHCNN